jgi:hypothetical protein
VRPRWKCTNQHQDQDYQKNCTKCHCCCFPYASRRRDSGFLTNARFANRGGTGDFGGMIDTQPTGCHCGQRTDEERDERGECA